MRFAVLADTHLATGQKERFEVLDWTLNDIFAQGIRVVFVAGDFCDNAPFPYDEIVSLFKRYPELNVYILLGNHDKTGGVFSEDFVGLDWVKVIDSPYLLRADIPILLLPYQEDLSLSEVLYREMKKHALQPSGFILISHGDLMYGDVFYEDKGYFPITLTDLRMAKPRLTLLGHIHVPLDFPEIRTYYCGSLCATSSNEFGLRRYGIFDDKGSVEWRVVKVGRFYWRERLFLPEKEELSERVADLIKALEMKFSFFPCWRSAINLSLRVVSLCPVKEEEVKEVFASEGIALNDLDILRVDTGGWLKLIGDFVKEVENLCAGEKDEIHWAKWRDEIVERGLIRFCEVVARIK